MAEQQMAVIPGYRKIRPLWVRAWYEPASTGYRGCGIAIEYFEKRPKIARRSFAVDGRLVQCVYAIGSREWAQTRMQKWLNHWKKRLSP